MKKKGWKKLAAGLLAFALCLLALPLGSTGRVYAADTYEITISASATAVNAGDTVSLTATVKKNGTEITDLAAAGLYLWFWTDAWASGHEDGLTDATYSNWDDNSGYSLTADVTLPSAGNYYVAASLQDTTWTDIADYAYISLTAAGDSTSAGDTASGDDGTDTSASSYAITITPSASEVKPGSTVTLTAAVTKDGEAITDLAAAGLYLWFWTDAWESGHEDGLTDAEYSNYDDNSGRTLSADVTLPSEGTYYITAQLQDSSYTNVVDNMYVTITVSADAAETADSASDSSDNSAGTSDASEGSDDATTNTTGDAAPVAALLAVLIGCGALAFASRKRFAK